MIKLLFTVSLFLFTCVSFSQTIRILANRSKISLRGLSVVDDKTFWASGSSGMVARSVDGGKTVTWQSVRGYETRDFRDVEAFDSATAIIMAIDAPAVILKTKDGGATWQKVFEDTTTGMFLDAMDFSGKYGVVVGDPIGGTMFMAQTEDWGDHWQIVAAPALAPDEAFFASSGTNVKMVATRHAKPLVYFASGGRQSRFFGLEKVENLPLQSGATTTGANSLACFSENKCIVVGGNFMDDKKADSNCVLIQPLVNGKQVDVSFTSPQTPPHGYRSCVEYLAENKLIACGTSGVDISNDGGLNWTLISNESFHVCRKAKKGSAVFLAGRDGRIAKFVE